MVRMVFLISFLFFFARFIYSSVGAWHHQQEKNRLQQSSLSIIREQPATR
ncbi:YfgG family protein [Apirhabdus apintestini]|nr:YfgG family protein [Erwinia sp. HR93]MEA1065674.1 YfgG family protein [Erwinia sp. HR93]WPM85463.1 YfgG family protein [Enterobacteriaceae bacterium CA-0114]